jgi:transcriptional regulator with XRE-family HTH domain
MLQTKLKYLRKEKGLTQDELALSLNENQATISNIETGKQKTIDLQLLYKIASYFEIEPYELLTENGTTINFNEKVENGYASHSQNIQTNNEDILQTLKEQINIKDRQLEEKDRQINSLMGLLNKD